MLAITAGLTALGSLAIHMFVPAMPVAAADLGISSAAIQLTLTVYLAAMAVGQFVSGPLSDAFGRRPLIIASAILFVAGSTLACFAPNLATLLAGRAVQALGGASGLIASRAMAGDRSGAQAARAVALLMSVAMFSPMLAPVLGAWLASAIGWRSVFALLAAAGLAIGACALLWLPETRPARGEAPSLKRMAADWRRLIVDRAFLRNLLIGCSLTAGLYVFLTASPFLLLRLGVAPSHLGLCFALVAGSLAAGALSAGALAGRVQPARLVRAAAWSAAAATCAFVAVAAAGAAGAATLLGAMTIYAFAGGLIAPNAMSGAMAAGQGSAGTAVSAYGAIQMGSNAVAAGAVAALPAGSVLAFALALAGAATLAALVAATRARLARLTSPCAGGGARPTAG